eukprot:5658455-Pyramimonas_sp.AAC.1
MGSVSQTQVSDACVDNVVPQQKPYIHIQHIQTLPGQHAYFQNRRTLTTFDMSQSSCARNCNPCNYIRLCHALVSCATAVSTQFHRVVMSQTVNLETIRSSFLSGIAQN